MLLAVVFVGLVLSLIISRVQLERLRQEYLDFRHTAGFLTPDEEGRFQFWQIGDFHGDKGFEGCTIVQVEEFAQYALKLTFYDGTTQAMKTHSFPLTDPETALTFLRHESPPRFYVQSNTAPFNNRGKLYEYFEVDVRSDDYVFADGIAMRGRIPDKPFCCYYFRPAENKLEGPNIQELVDKSEEGIKSLCDKYQWRCVSITLEKR